MISVVIPVLNGGARFRRCLEGLYASEGVAWECLVVDDGSSDGSLAVARRRGATLLHTRSPRSGPAVARNLGAFRARGELLLFLDCDVEVRPDSLARIAAHFAGDPVLAACFGSYDDRPAAPNFLSQYKNLQHHFVHQQGDRDARTFWSGCGAIRREIFLEVGGFTTAYGRPCIEDIELGYRLHAAGYSLRLDPELQVKHLKRWTAWDLLLTDVRDRAWPWARLLLARRALADDLNLAREQRASGLLAVAASAALLAGRNHRAGRSLAAVAGGCLLLLNRRFYLFLRRERGVLFLLKALPWHWLYFLYSSVAFAVALAAHLAGVKSTPNPARACPAPRTTLHSEKR